MKIFHNPRCSKSRNTLAILEEKGANHEIVLYLKTPPTKDELQSLLKKLEMRPFDLIRKGEQIYKENYKGKDFTDEEWIGILLKHPKLIERPIVVKDNKAVIGRPPEKVLELL